MFDRILRLVLVVALTGTLSQPVWAAAYDDEKPGAFTMVGDLVVARPVGVVITAVGAVAWVVALPFSALGGNVEGSAEALVLGPARETFQRCLGCRMTGRYQDPNEMN